MAVWESASGWDAEVSHDEDRRAAVAAADRVIEAARVALERGDETSAEDLLNAIKPPDGPSRARMTVLHATIRDIRISRRRFDGSEGRAPLASGQGRSADAPAWPDGAIAAPVAVDDALVAWQFVEAPGLTDPADTPVSASGGTSTEAEEHGPSAVPRPGEVLDSTTGENATAPRTWRAVLAGVALIAGTVCLYLLLR